MDRNSTCLPWYSALLAVQSAFIARIRSRITAPRSAKRAPWSSSSSWFQPAPMPKRKRPPERRSSVATLFAVWIGSRCATRQMPVATFSVRVAAAATASATNGSITS